MKYRYVVRDSKSTCMCRPVLLLAGVILAMVAQSAAAQCSARARALGDCQTNPPHAVTRASMARPQAGPAPVERHADPASTHAIIFVGGKRAINSQPVPPGHAPHAPLSDPRVKTSGH